MVLSCLKNYRVVVEVRGRPFQGADCNPECLVTSHSHSTRMHVLWRRVRDTIKNLYLVTTILPLFLSLIPVAVHWSILEDFFFFIRLQTLYPWTERLSQVIRSSTILSSFSFDAFSLDLNFQLFSQFVKSACIFSWIMYQSPSVYTSTTHGNEQIIPEPKRT